MPRKPASANDLFEQFAERLLERVVFPALEDRFFPLVDQLLGPPPAPRNKPVYTRSPRTLPRVKTPPAAAARPARALATTYYDVLQVSPKADREVIRAAYRNLSQRFHPDHNPGNKAAEERFKRIAEAYGVLEDAQKRAAYDRSRGIT